MTIVIASRIAGSWYPSARPGASRWYVSIGTIPYGQVIVDGKRVGAAPVVVKLAPGPHRIVGRAQRLRRAETVVVSPEVNQVVLDLRNEPPLP